MKKINILILGLFIFLSCKEEKLNYATFSGKIENTSQKELVLFGKNFSKKIKLNTDGSFYDTINIKVPTTNGITINGKQLPIFIRNGYNLKANIDANDLPGSIKYSGIGSEENNYLLAQFIYGGKANNSNIFSLDENKFSLKLEDQKRGLDSINKLYNTIDTLLLSLTKKQNIKIFKLIENLYATTKEASKIRAKGLKKLKKGTVSPKFFNFETLNGEKRSLDDFKNKYIFIDIWGTWATSYFKNSKKINAFKKRYTNKNISFLSICMENVGTSGTIRHAKEKWKNKINEYNLIGTHLFPGTNKDFANKYFVSNLPRYILIDPKGNIIDADAPGPSDIKLTQLFNTLNLK